MGLSSASITFITIICTIRKELPPTWHSPTGRPHHSGASRRYSTSAIDGTLSQNGIFFPPNRLPHVWVPEVPVYERDGLMSCSRSGCVSSGVPFNLIESFTYIASIIDTGSIVASFIGRNTSKGGQRPRSSPTAQLSILYEQCSSNNISLILHNCTKGSGAPFLVLHSSKFSTSEPSWAQRNLSDGHVALQINQQDGLGRVL